MWPFKKPKQINELKPLKPSCPSSSKCDHKYREFDWYIESSFSVVGHKRGEEVGNLDTRIYKPYVCIHCKHRKNVVLKEMTRVGVTWREALEENSVLAKSHADKIRPKPEVEEEIADFQLIDREYLKIAQSLFPDRDILKEDPSA